MAKRPCLATVNGQPCPNLTDGKPRCRRHDRHAPTDWARTSAAILTDWRATHGSWCPGHGRDPHTSDDLTTHHTDDPTAPYTVLCRSCNAAAG